MQNGYTAGRLMAWPAIWLVIGLVATAGAQTFPLLSDVEPGPYAVGIKFENTFDRSRTFNVPKYTYEGEFNDTERARPVPISVWFPAKSAPGAAYMTYDGYYLPPAVNGQALSEPQKAAALQGIKNSPLGQAMSEDAFSKLMNTKTAVVQNAEPAEGSFPLLVFAQGFNQFPTAQTLICEHLASHGYIVATTRSRGHRGSMTNDLTGVEAQTRDLEYIISHMQDFPALDKDRLGVIAFSFGGLPGAVLAMRNSDVEAVLSLDSGLGSAAGFATLFQSPYYDTQSVRAAFMHLMPEPAPNNSNLGFLNDLTYADRHVVTIAGMRHFDFSAYGLINDTYPNFAVFMGAKSGDVQAGTKAILTYARNFFDAYIRNDEKALALLRKPASEAGFSTDLVSMTAYEAPPAPPSENDIAALVTSGRIDEVVDIYRKFHEKDPELDLFQEATMNNLGYQLLGQQRLEEAIEVFRLNVEAYPESWNVYDSLAEAYNANGQRDLAVEYYSEALERNPGDQRIIGILDNLKNADVGSANE